MAYYGEEFGLPRAISGHNSYYFWGPQGCTGEVLITVGRPERDLSGCLRERDRRQSMELQVLHAVREWHVDLHRARPEVPDGRRVAHDEGLELAAIPEAGDASLADPAYKGRGSVRNCRGSWALARPVARPATWREVRRTTT